MMAGSLRWVVVAASAAGLQGAAGCAGQDHLVRTSPAGPASVSGTAVKNLQRDGRILVGGEIAEAGLEELYQAGVRTIIDVRNEPDKMAAEAERVRRRGLRYVAIPMASNQMTGEQAQALLEAMNQHRSGDVLIHCVSGNRAAGAYGYYLGASGQCPVQEALDRAKKAGLRNEQLAEAVRAHLATRPAGRTGASTRPGP